MNDPIDSLAHLDPEPEETDVPEERKSSVKRRQPEWNALRRTLPEAEKLVVRQPPILPAFQKPLKPIGVKR